MALLFIENSYCIHRSFMLEWGVQLNSERAGTQTLTFRAIVGRPVSFPGVFSCPNQLLSPAEMYATEEAGTRQEAPDTHGR